MIKNGIIEVGVNNKEIKTGDIFIDYSKEEIYIVLKRCISGVYKIIRGSRYNGLLRDSEGNGDVIVNLVGDKNRTEAFKIDALYMDMQKSDLTKYKHIENGVQGRVLIVEILNSILQDTSLQVINEIEIESNRENTEVSMDKENVANEFSNEFNDCDNENGESLCEDQVLEKSLLGVPRKITKRMGRKPKESKWVSDYNKENIKNKKDVKDADKGGARKVTEDYLKYVFSNRQDTFCDSKEDYEDKTDENEDAENTKTVKGEKVCKHRNRNGYRVDGERLEHIDRLLRETTMSYVNIGKEVGCSTQTVFKRQKELGLRKTTKGGKLLKTGGKIED